MKQKPDTNLVMYITEDGLTKITASFDKDTVWLSLDQMADLFQKNKSTISRHIKNIFTEGELMQNSVVANYATTATDGKKYNVDYYNLDELFQLVIELSHYAEYNFVNGQLHGLKNILLKALPLMMNALKVMVGAIIGRNYLLALKIFVLQKKYFIAKFLTFMLQVWIMILIVMNL